MSNIQIVLYLLALLSIYLLAATLDELTDRGKVCDRQCLLPWEFEHHPLNQAMVSRQWFAAPGRPPRERGADHA